MKAPSQNISKSLKGQASKGRGNEEISVQQQRAGGPTMTVPGDGKVETAPGTAQAHEGDRSAEKYAEPMSRYGGK